MPIIFPAELALERSLICMYDKVLVDVILTIVPIVASWTGVATGFFPVHRSLVAQGETSSLPQIPRPWPRSSDSFGLDTQDRSRALFEGENLGATFAWKSSCSVCRRLASRAYELRCGVSGQSYIPSGIMGRFCPSQCAYHKCDSQVTRKLLCKWDTVLFARQSKWSPGFLPCGQIRCGRGPWHLCWTTSCRLDIWEPGIKGRY